MQQCSARFFGEFEIVAVFFYAIDDNLRAVEQHPLIIRQRFDGGPHPIHRFLQAASFPEQYASVHHIGGFIARLGDDIAAFLRHFGFFKDLLDFGN